MSLSVTHSYTTGMKTAVSIPDHVFDAAEELAHQLGITRSELYTTALARLLASHRDARITARLNEVYADEPAQLDPLLAQLQFRAIAAEEW